MSSNGITLVTQKSEYSIIKQVAQEMGTDVAIVASSGEMFDTGTGYTYVLDDTLVAINIAPTDFGAFWNRVDELQGLQQLAAVTNIAEPPVSDDAVTAPNVYQQWVKDALHEGWSPVAGEQNSLTCFELMSPDGRFFASVEWGDTPAITIWDCVSDGNGTVIPPYSMEAVESCCS